MDHLLLARCRSLYVASENSLPSGVHRHLACGKTFELVITVPGSRLVITIIPESLTPFRRTLINIIPESRSRCVRIVDHHPPNPAVSSSLDKLAYPRAAGLTELLGRIWATRTLFTLARRALNEDSAGLLHESVYNTRFSANSIVSPIWSGPGGRRFQILSPRPTYLS